VYCIIGLVCQIYLLKCLHYKVNIGKTKVMLSCYGPVRCQDQVDGLAVFVEQGWDLTQWKVLVMKNGCTKMQLCKCK
jgi:hypothetical protein